MSAPDISMTTVQTKTTHELPAVIAAAVAKYGARRVFALTLWTIVARRPQYATTDHLNDHLRRDVGLPPRLDHEIRETYIL